MGILMKNGKNYSSASNPMSVTQDESGTIVLEGFVGDTEHFVDNGARDRIKIIETNLSTEAGFTDYIPYPSGFTVDNSMAIVSIYFNGWRNGVGLSTTSFFRTFVDTSSQGIRCYNNDSNLIGARARILLVRII